MARRSSGRRADLRWTFGSFTFAAFSAGTSGGTIVTAGSTSQTLMRTRGEISAWLDGTSTPGEGMQIGVGMYVVPGGTGATVLSSPLTDGEAPFFYYEVFQLAYEEMVTDVIDVPQMTSVRKTIDVKAMRVIRPDQEVQVVAENVTNFSAGAVNIVVNARFLLAD